MGETRSRADRGLLPSYRIVFQEESRTENSRRRRKEDERRILKTPAFSIYALLSFLQCGLFTPEALTLVLCDVDVARRRARELRSTDGALRLGGHSGFLALMSQ